MTPDLWYRALGGSIPLHGFPHPLMVMQILEQDDGDGNALLRLALPGHKTVRFRLNREVVAEVGLVRCLSLIEAYEHVVYRT